jgi:hypothetical protein
VRAGHVRQHAFPLRSLYIGRGWNADDAACWQAVWLISHLRVHRVEGTSGDAHAHLNKMLQFFNLQRENDIAR